MSTVEAMASPAVPPSRTGTRSRMFSWALAAGLTRVPTGRAGRGIPRRAGRRPTTVARRLGPTRRTTHRSGAGRSTNGRRCAVASRQLELGHLAVVVGAERLDARGHELLRAQRLAGVVQRLVVVVHRDLGQLDPAVLQGPAGRRRGLDVVVDAGSGHRGAKLLRGQDEVRLVGGDARPRARDAGRQVAQRRVGATAPGEGQRDEEAGAGGERGSRGRPDGIRALVHRYPERVSEPDRPRDTTAARLAAEAPLARGAVVAALSAVVLGFTFVPQLLGLALAGLSLVRREPGGRRPALLAVGISLLLTVVWGVVLGLLLKWWAASR